MKSYYHAHEIAYQRIREKGFVGWGDAAQISELGDPKTKQFLLEKIKSYFSGCQGKKALDLGCGTGTTAFILAELGFQTTAIDISETAVKMGKDIADQLNLDINFIQGDVLNLDRLDDRFDLVYDSHLLHCLVPEEDRVLFYSQVRERLSADGLFIVDTMVSAKEPSSMKFLPQLRFDKDYILWHKTRESDVRGVQLFNNELWCMQRRIYPSEQIVHEVQQVPFQILESRIDHSEENPSMLRLILKKRAYP